MDCPTNIIKFLLSFLYNYFLINFQHARLIQIFQSFCTETIHTKDFFLEDILIQNDPYPAVSVSRFLPISYNETLFFTDGSKTINLSFADFAVFDATNDIIYRFRTSNKILIFLCEAMAIIMALKIALKSPINKFPIFSDSKIVLQALLLSKKKKYTSHLILTILERLETFSNADRIIHLFSISAYSNIDGNERADRAAEKKLLQ